MPITNPQLESEMVHIAKPSEVEHIRKLFKDCLLYTSDAADE